jgi:hypothetical protein
MSTQDFCKPHDTTVVLDTASQDTTREPAAPSNALLGSGLATAPIDADPDGRDALATTLLGLLRTDGPPAPPTLIGDIVGYQSLPARSALYLDAAFWNRPEWRDGKLSRAAVRDQVDPLRAVDHIATTHHSGPQRAAALRGILIQLPGDRDRLVRDSARRAALLAGLEAVDRHRVLHAMTNPTAPDIDAASLFVASVHASDAIAARQAWSAASVEPGAAARLARDADLMARLRQLSTDLAEQVR